MSTPILATKLYIPPPRPKAVLRSRLIERLNEGLHRKLTLISAPAGFGKTTLVSEWVAGCERPAAWLSLDEGDNDPTRFLAYLITALQTIAANIGEGVLGVLQSPQPPPTESILTALLNEITTIPDNLVLVLDDYHVIEAKPVDNALTLLLEHLPPQMHLVIATREDPDLPLARLRAGDQLTELRVTDLRFTASEAANFLNQVMDLNLSAEDIAALETRTEGWIAGLQLAALALQGTVSMQGHQDAAGFIKSFTGSHHFVMDYLVEEVLHQQSESVQSFLLQTSILDRLCGPLCDAVLPKSSASGQETLEYLERANLLVVPLDDKREWYRYHHLFADVLQARLMKERPDQVADLHLRACAWWAQNNFRSDAIRHALAAEDFERSADLLEQEWSASSGTYFQSATWLSWVKALPDELVRTRPWLSIGFAWELLFSGELEAAEARMRDADRWLERTADLNDPSEAPSTSMVVVNEEKSRSVRASLALARAFHAQALGDVVGTVTHARRALTLVSEANYHMRGVASAQLGLACWTNGDLETAYKYMADAMAGLRMAGNLLFANSCAFVLAEVRIAQGRLLDAINTYEKALQLVTTQDEPVLQGTANLYLGLSELYRERGNVEAASQHLLRSEELGKQAGSPDWPYPLYLAQAQIKESQGDLDGALELLDEAERLYHRSPVPDVRPVAALKARVWIRQGRLAEALGWAHRRDLSVDDDLSYLREFEHVTLARVLIARYKSDRAERSIHDADGLLERLLKVAEEGGRMGSVIEILVLQALAHEAQGNIPLALVPLERALTVAEPEGYVRVFVHEGIPMAELLTRMNASREGGRPVPSTGSGRALSEVVNKHIHRLLAAFGKQKDVQPSAFSPQPLVEPLSERELEVLRLLGTELNGPAIARELLVSLNTMRTHTKNIYSKLGANNRRAAVRRAEELDLL
jgi:LuxR family maltose regulon positive regulatory protein